MKGRQNIRIMYYVIRNNEKKDVYSIKSIYMQYLSSIDGLITYYYLFINYLDNICFHILENFDYEIKFITYIVKSGSCQKNS